MMNDITIVTAFYDIGRENWKYYQRKTAYYFECFERLCQLKNKIIVFSELKFKSYFDEIIHNKKSDLIVVYEDIFESNRELLSKIEKSQKFLQKKGGLCGNGNPPEYWCPEYVLVNYLKSYFCISAIEKISNMNDIVSWIDFGYLKKQKQIPDSKIWKYNFTDKIHLWNIQDIPEVVNITKTIKNNTVYIQGCHIVCTKNKWYDLNNLMKQQLNNLFSYSLVDDDQTLLLLSYISDPQKFCLHKEIINYQDLDWFFIFKYYNLCPEFSYK